MLVTSSNLDRLLAEEWGRAVGTAERTFRRKGAVDLVAESEDVVSQAFMKAHPKLYRRIAGAGSIEKAEAQRWLHRNTIDVATNMLEKWGRRQGLVEENFEGSYLRDAATANIRQMAARRALLALFRVARGCVSRRGLFMLIRIRLWGWTREEVASRYGLTSAKAVRDLCEATLEQLRALARGLWGPDGPGGCCPKRNLFRESIERATSDAELALSDLDRGYWLADPRSYLLLLQWTQVSPTVLDMKPPGGAGFPQDEGHKVTRWTGRADHLRTPDTLHIRLAIPCKESFLDSIVLDFVLAAEYTEHSVFAEGYTSLLN